MRDETETMIADCEARESRLSDWERDFIDSLRHRIDMSRPLTDRQIETLESVWDKATARG